MPVDSKASQSRDSSPRGSSVSPTQFRWPHIMIAGAMAVAAWCLFAFTAMDHLRKNRISQASPSWPSEFGVVTTDGEVRYGRRANRMSRGIYASIEYRYEIDDQEFRGSHFTVNNRLLDASDFPVYQYREGANVEVFYDPSQPSVSLLKPGPPIRGEGSVLFLTFCAGLAMSGLTIAFYFMLRHQRQQKTMTRQQRRMAERQRTRRRRTDD